MSLTILDFIQNDNLDTWINDNCQRCRFGPSNKDNYVIGPETKELSYVGCTYHSNLEMDMIFGGEIQKDTLEFVGNEHKCKQLEEI